MKNQSRALLALLALSALACGSAEAQPDGAPGGASGGAAGSGATNAGSGGSASGGAPPSGGSSGLGGSAGSGVAGGAGSYPMPDWPSGDAVSVGIDVGKLDEAANYAESIGSKCVLVIRDGKIVYERYFADNDKDSLHASWSIAKSVTSALVGIAIKRGEIKSVDDKVADYIPAWQGTEKAQLTLRHLLGMVPGLQFSLISDTTFTVYANDFTKQAIERKLQNPPESIYQYSNLTVQLFEPIFRAATGMDIEDYAKKYLWQPLGFGKDTYWFRDNSGNVAPFMGVYATCRDFARLGYLYLHDGVWESTQIVDAGHVADSKKPGFPVNRAHNYYWWLNGQVPAQTATQSKVEGMLHPTAPTDMFSAQGLGGNFVDVVPSRNTLYVHMRPAPIDDWNDAIKDLPGTIQKLIADSQRKEHEKLWEYFHQAG